MLPELDFIFRRRSVRRFKVEPVAESLITALLQAGMAAPSARARDPWHFLVLRERHTLDRVVEILPNGTMLKDAPLCILACGDITRAHDGQTSYLLQDLSAAVENILLAAATLGLGGCWLGVHPRSERMDALARLFSLPEQIIPVAGIALGWPVQHPEPRTRYQDNLVHWEKW